MPHILKMWPSRHLFLYFCLFNTAGSTYRFSRWLDSTCWSLVSKATALPTAPQPLPINAPCWYLFRNTRIPTFKYFYRIHYPFGSCDAFAFNETGLICRFYRLQNDNYGIASSDSNNTFRVNTAKVNCEELECIYFIESILASHN